MGYLLRIASLLVFAAIGIALAISVATHLRPDAEDSHLANAGRLEAAAGQSVTDNRPAAPVILAAGSASSEPAVASPRRLRPDNGPVGQDEDAHNEPQEIPFPRGGGLHGEHPTDVSELPRRPGADARIIPPNPVRPNPGQLDPGQLDPGQLDPGQPHFGQPDSMGPILWQPDDGAAIPQRSRAATVPPPTASLPLQHPLTVSQQPQVANYQPLVTAHLDLLRDAIVKIERTQKETTQLVSKLQDGQIRAAVPVEDVPLPPTERGPAEPNVTMHDDKLTLIFQDSDIKAVLNAIGTEAGLNILTSESVTGLVSATLTDVEIHTALDAVLKSRGLVARHEGNIVYVGTHEELHFVQHGGDLVMTRVYRPNYISAQDLQTLLTPLLSKGTGQVTISTAAEVGIASDSANAGGNSYTGEEVVVVRDFDGILAQIDQLVAEVDRMPRQVSIEAMILSVTLDDKNEMGVDFELLRQQDTLRITSGTPLVDLTTAPFKDGLKIGFLDSSLFVFVNALETIGDTNVVASPRVMCLNKQRAEILIGAELGYVSTTITETAATQAVEFLEVGTQLSIRPFISSEGMIRMEVHPELSTGSVRVESGFTLPDKEVTQVTTNVMCPNGATVVIGGLIREDLVTSSTQIPLLGNLPWVGPAFRQRREEIDRKEIIVLLTPRIVNEAELWAEGQAYTKQFKDRRNVFLDKMDPLGKRHLAERHLRKARAAWAAGDVDMALRYCNMAIHFDPLHRDAIALRGELISAAPELEISVHEHLRHGLDPGSLPHRDYSKHGYPWQSLELDQGASHATVGDTEVDGMVPGIAPGGADLPRTRSMEIVPPPASLRGP